MAIDYIFPTYEVVRDLNRCTVCRICETQCSHQVHRYDAGSGQMLCDEARCVDCLRCVSFCPTHALKIKKNDCAFRQNANWSQKSIEEIYKQASSSGADIIAIDGFRGGTGAAPTRIRDNVGIPIELALAAVDQRLRDEGIRNRVSIIAGGSIRSSADVIKAVALGADACCIAAAALLAMAVISAAPARAQLQLGNRDTAAGTDRAAGSSDRRETIGQPAYRVAA